MSVRGDSGPQGVGGYQPLDGGASVPGDSSVGQGSRGPSFGKKLLAMAKVFCGRAATFAKTRGLPALQTLGRKGLDLMQRLGSRLPGGLQRSFGKPDTAKWMAKLQSAAADVRVMVHSQLPDMGEVSEKLKDASAALQEKLEALADNVGDRMAPYLEQAEAKLTELQAHLKEVTTELHGKLSDYPQYRTALSTLSHAQKKASTLASSMQRWCNQQYTSKLKPQVDAFVRDVKRDAPKLRKEIVDGLKSAQGELRRLATAAREGASRVDLEQICASARGKLDSLRDVMSEVPGKVSSSLHGLREGLHNFADSISRRG